MNGQTRVLSPDGDLCLIPNVAVEEALSEGFRVMEDADMADMFNRQELERRFFEKRWKKQGGKKFSLRRMGRR